MTTPSSPRITPKRIFIAIALLITLILVFTPIQDTSTDSRLSSYNRGRSGAAGTYEVLRHLKFAVTRATNRFSDTMSARPIYVVLRNVVPFSEAEIRTLQEAVRRGAGLLIAPGNDSLATAFDFSLTRVDQFVTPVTKFGMVHDPIPWDIPAIMSNAADNSVYAGMVSAPQIISPKGKTWPSPPMVFMEYDSTAQFDMRSDSVFWEELSKRQHEQAATSFNVQIDSQTITQIDADSSQDEVQADIQVTERPSRFPRRERLRSHLPVMLGTTYGAGQVVLLSTPSLLTNETARGRTSLVAAVNALQWMGGDKRLIVFDEYHQGYGLHADISDAIMTVLTTTRPGWAVLQGLVAAALLLLAVGVRPLAPTSHLQAQRRSPLEHVTALANAYTQTDARTFGIEQLIRGLRRRHPLGVNRNAPADIYLAIIRSNFPKAHDAVDALLAMHHGALPAKLSETAALIATIENQFPSAGTPTSANRSSQFI